MVSITGRHLRPQPPAGPQGAVALMSGAVFFHTVSPLGIDRYDDGAVLFTEACETLACALFIVFALRAEISTLIGRVPVLRRTLGSAPRQPIMPG